MRTFLTHREQTQMLAPWHPPFLRVSAVFPDDASHQAHLDMVERTINDLYGQGVDSRYLYGQPDSFGRTRWDPDRRRQHRELVRDLWNKYGATVPAEGRALVMGGLGGAGKGKVQRNPDLIDTHNYFRIDPDDIKKEMAARGMIPEVEGLSPMEASPLVHEEASELAKQLALQAYKDKTNVLHDLTMSGDKSIADRVKDMRKAGYHQIDAAFVDTDYDIARQRAIRRHRHGEEQYRTGQGGYGGRVVPESVARKNLPSPGSPHASRNAEVFHRLRPMFDNTAVFDVRGEHPVIASTTGFRWNQPRGAAQSSSASPSDPREQLVASTSPHTTRSLLKAYEDGQIEFPALLSLLAQHTPTPQERPRDLGEAYDRAEEMPDDDDPFWIVVATNLGVLTEEEEQQLLDALGEYPGGF